MGASVVGSVYLLHFEPAFKHARHYVGWASHVRRRVGHHRAGRGAAITAAAVKANVALYHARTWRRRTRTFERSLKNRDFGELDVMCPVCTGLPVRKLPRMAVLRLRRGRLRRAKRKVK